MASVVDLAAASGISTITVRRFLEGRVAQRSSRARVRILAAMEALDAPQDAPVRHGASVATLERRTRYGGRKGRCAAKRLARLR